MQWTTVEVNVATQLREDPFLKTALQHALPIPSLCAFFLKKRIEEKTKTCDNLAIELI